MTGSFHISLFEGTLHVDKILVWFKLANITHALPVPVYRQSDFRPKRVGRLAFTWYRCKISYRSEILAPLQEPGWTQAGFFLLPANFSANGFLIKDCIYVQKSFVVSSLVPITRENDVSSRSIACEPQTHFRRERSDDRTCVCGSQASRSTNCRKKSWCTC